MKLKALLAKKLAKPVPKGWLTREQLHKREGLATAQGDRVIRAAVKEGLLERRMWMLPTACGALRSCPIYRYTK